MRINILNAILPLLALSFECVAAFGNPKTSFGIFVDSATYDACRQELEAYKNQLISEGLKADIFAKNWQNPDEVRAKVKELASKPDCPLEGIVLVGDMPIAMIREAQWLTTAFKMNEQRFPIFESSVASDRFYDDFDLEFDFLSKDEKRSDVFYYRLSERGAQYLLPDIYSARMKVPECMGGDKYEILAKYLRKVVAAHQERNNKADNITFFFGKSYNSEDLNVWRQKPLLYKEHFPEAFKKASGNRFLTFKQAPQMKWTVMSELQREDLDIFQFTEHGAYDTQYLSGVGEGHSLEENLFLLRSAIAKQYLRWKSNPEEERIKQVFPDSLFQLPSRNFSDSALALYHKYDSAATRNANILQEELYGVKSNARIVILNACYNGSFHNNEGYIAGVHVFGDGKCVLAQANTVNVLQDKFEDKLIGLLSLGLRAGMWQKEVPYLESHLIGDPTFRFAGAGHKVDTDKLTSDLIRKPKDSRTWKRWLKNSNPIVRASAIAHLSHSDSPQTGALALDILKKDPSPIVRQCAFFVLEARADEYAQEAILTAANDPIEVLARHACLLAAAMGSAGKDGEILRAMENLYENHPELLRVNMQAENALRVISGGGFLDSESAKINDKSLSENKRILALRSFRNYRYAKAKEEILRLAGDDSESESIRKVACEVMGWYSKSPDRAHIIREFKKMLSSEKTMPETVRVEILKTVKRLEHK